MANAMKSVTKSLIAINKQVSIPALQKMMAEFAKENERSELGQEMMGDAMDSVMEDDTAEASDVVEQVLAELGIQQSAAVPEAPTNQPKTTAAAQETQAGI